MEKTTEPKLKSEGSATRAQAASADKTNHARGTEFKGIQYSGKPQKQQP